MSRPEAFEREKDIYRAQAAATGKPPQVVEKIVEGKMGQVLRRGLPVGAALHQGPDCFHRTAHPIRSASWARTSPYAASARFKVGEGWGDRLLLLSLLRRKKNNFRGCFGSPFFSAFERRIDSRES